MTNGDFPAGWYQDPTGQGDARYWNGVSWTQSVNRGGATVNVAIDPSQAQTPPVPGTQVSVAPPSTGSTPSSNRSMLGIILGVVVVLLLVAVLYAIVNNDDSSDDGPPATGVPAVTDAPDTGAPVTEATAPPASDGG